MTPTQYRAAQRSKQMETTGYTTAELASMIVRIEEGRLYLPAKMLKEVKAEIARRKSA